MRKSSAIAADIRAKSDDVRTATWHAMLVSMRALDVSSIRKSGQQRKTSVIETADRDAASPPMAVSIAGVSTACSKEALVSSAKAVEEALSTE